MQDEVGPSIGCISITPTTRMYGILAKAMGTMNF